MAEPNLESYQTIWRPELERVFTKSNTNKIGYGEFLKGLQNSPVLLNLQSMQEVAFKANMPPKDFISLIGSKICQYMGHKTMEDYIATNLDLFKAVRIEGYTKALKEFAEQYDMPFEDDVVILNENRILSVDEVDNQMVFVLTDIDGQKVTAMDLGDVILRRAIDLDKILNPILDEQQEVVEEESPGQPKF